MIIWKGKTTSGIHTWTVTEKTFSELYNSLCEMNIINESNGSPLEEAKLEKIGKSLNDYCTDTEDGDVDMDYETYQHDMDSVSLSDKDIMYIIKCENGEAYYQEFYKEIENRKTKLSEITSDDFDSNGNFKY